MSTTIDQKIVEMKFDNSDFEKHTKESMSTLDKLKDRLRLKGATDGLEEVGRAADELDFKKTISGLDKASSIFQSFFNIGINALTKLTDEATKFAKSVTFDQLGAGFSKYEEKVAAVQTIMSATGKGIDEVTEKLEQLQWFSDETSYSFTDMSSNVGKFTSAGVGLDSAVNAMQGIANWAAISGQNAQSASRAMYNLSQSMGLGYLQLMDWKSIENANMATMAFKEAAIEAGLAMGTLYEKYGQVYTVASDTLVTAEGLRDSLSDKWFNKDVLETVLGRYGDFASAVRMVQERMDIGTASQALMHIDQFIRRNDIDGSTESMIALANAFDLTEKEAALLYETYNSLGKEAFIAAQQAKTWSDVVDATKDAVSSTWMRLFESIFGDYQDAKVLFTDMANEFWNIFAGPVDIVASAFEESMSHKGAWNTLMDALSGDSLQKSAEDFEDAMLKVTEGMTFKYGKIEALWDDVDNGIEKGDLIDAEYTLDELIAKFGSLEKVSERGLLDFDLFERAFQEMGVSVGQVNDEMGQLNELQETSYELLQATGKGGRIIFIEGFAKIYRELKKIFTAIQTAFTNVFSTSLVDRLDWIIETFHTFAGELEITEETAERITTTFEGIFKSFRLAISVIGGVGTAIMGVISRVVPVVTRILGGVVETVSGYVGTLSEVFTGVFEVAYDYIVEGIENFESSEFYNTIKGTIDKLKGYFKEIGDSIDKYISDLTVDSVVEFFKTLGGAIATLADQIVSSELAQNAISLLTGLISDLGEAIKNFKMPTMKELTEALNNFFNGIWLNKLTSFEDLKNALINFFSYTWKSKFKKFTEAIQQLFIKGKTDFTSVLEWLWNTAGMITKVVSRFVHMAASDIYIATKNILALGQMFAVFKFIMSGSKLLDAIRYKIKGNDASGGLEGVLIAVANILKTLGVVVAEMAGLVYLLGQIPQAQLQQGMSALEVMVGSLGILIVLVELFGSTTQIGEKQWATALTIVAFGYVLKQLCDIMVELGSYKVDNWGNTIFGIVAFVGMMIGVYFMLSKMSKMTLSSSLPILALATGMKMMLQVFQEYQNFNWSKNTKGITTAATVIAGMIKVLGYIAKASGSDAKSAALILVGFALALKVIVSVIKDLGTLKASTIAKGELALIGISAFMLLIVKVFEKMNTSSIDDAKLTTKLGTFLGLVVLLMAAVAAIVILGKQPEDVLKKGVTSVTLILAAIAAVLFGLGKLGDVGFGKLAAVIAGIVLIMTAMAAIYKYLLAGVDYTMAEQALTTLAKMLGLVALVAVAAYGLSYIPGGEAAITSGLGIIAKVGAFLAVVTGIVAAVAGLVDLIPGAEKFLEGAARVTGLLGNVIGAFFGGLAGGAVGAFSAAQASWLPAMAEGVSNFFTKLQPVLAMFGSDGKTGSLVPSMDDAGRFTASMADLIKSLGSMGSNANKLKWTETAAEKIKKFFTQLLLDGQFAEALDEVDNVSVTNAGIVAQIVEKLAPLANTGGIKKLWSGTNDFDKLSRNLDTFGKAIVKFATAIAGKEVLGKSLSNELNNFSEIATSIFDLYEVMPTDQSWLEKILDGSKNWGFIADNLDQFVKDVAGLVADLKTNPMKKEDVEQIKMFAEVIKELSYAYDQLPEKGGFLESIGSKLAGLFTGGEQEEGWETMMSSLESLVERLKTFADNISNLKDSDAYKKARENIDIMFKEMAGAVMNNTELWSEAGKTIMSYLVSGIRGKVLESIGANGLVTESATKIRTAFDSLKEDMFKTGQSIATSISDGMLDKRKEMYETMGNLLLGAVLATKNGYGSSSGVYTKFKEVGHYAAEGFKAGLTSGYAAYLAKSGGSQLGKWAYEAAKKAIESSSPSKKFMELGEYSAEGYNIGVVNSLGSVSSTMTRMGETSMNTLKDTVSRLASSIEASPNAQPTIRPVLDMTDIDDGLSSISKGNYNIGLYGNATTSGLTSSIKLQNGGNTVAGAISSLKSDLNDMKNEILGMQLVVDSGALVGSISSKMDGALGTISTYKGRGNL